MVKPRIQFERVGKRYRLGTRGGLRDAIAALPGRLRKRNGHDDNREFWALTDVSLELQPGETLGLIGPNGAGKTTILKLIARINRPTTGRLEVNGRVSSLIELGAGFHPDLTGRENVYLNAMILGMRRRDVDRLFDAIVAFAELERFIDTPVKRYSSGMYARLGFAVAAHVDPDILLVDEVLSVGDASFQRRCYEKMWDLVHQQGRSVIMVSHGFGYIRMLCQRVIWLQNGRIRQIGAPDEVIRSYESSVFGRSASAPLQGRDEPQVQIISGILLDEQARPADVFNPLDAIVVRIVYQSSPAIDSLAFAVGVMRDDTLNCYTTFSDEGGLIVPTENSGGMIEARYDQLRLMPGSYQMYVTACSADEKRTIYTYRTIGFRIDAPGHLDIRHGSFYNMPQWRLIQTQEQMN